MAKRYRLLGICIVLLFLIIQECRADIQSFTNYGNGWISSGYQENFDSDNNPQMHTDLSGFYSPLNPFTSSQHSGFSSNSYSSSYLGSSRFPPEDTMDTRFNLDLSEPTKVRVSSSLWPWSQDFSSVSLDTSDGTYERHLESIADKIKDYISSSDTKLGFKEGNDYMKASKITTYTQMSDLSKEMNLHDFKSNFHDFEANLPISTSAHDRIISKVNYDVSPEKFSISKKTSFKMPLPSSTPTPAPHILPSSNILRKPQIVENKQHRSSYNQILTTRRPRFENKLLEKSSVNKKYPPKYFPKSTYNLNNKTSSPQISTMKHHQGSKSNYTSKLQLALKNDNSSLSSSQQIYSRTESSLASGNFIMTAKNKNKALSSESLISSKYENLKPSIQVQNRSSSGTNTSENVSTKPIHRKPISSANQTTSLNEHSTSKKPLHNKSNSSSNQITPLNEPGTSEKPLHIKSISSSNQTRSLNEPGTSKKPLHNKYISSSNQTRALNESSTTNNTNSRKDRIYRKLSADFYTSTEYVYIKEYETSSSRFRDLLVGLIQYNMVRSHHHYHKHFYNDDFYRTRVSMLSNNLQGNNSVLEVATCTLNIKEKDKVILLKIPCEIVSTFTDGSHLMEATNITETTICTTNTTILNNELSKLKQKLMKNDHSDLSTVTEMENLLNTTTTVSTTNISENVSRNSSDNIINSSKPVTSNDLFKSTINTTPLVSRLKTTVDDLTKNTVDKSGNTILSSKLEGNFVQDVKTILFSHQDLELITILTCTTEVADPLIFKGAPVNISNIECNVEIHKQTTFLSNHVNCKTLLRYAKLYKLQ